MTDDGPRLLLGAPIAAEIRATVARDVDAIPAGAVTRRRWPWSSSAATRRRPSTSTRSCARARRSASRAGWSRCRPSVVDGAAVRDRAAEPGPAGRRDHRPDAAAASGSRCSTVIDTLDPAKDIDGLHPRNAGLLSLGYEGFLPTTAHAAVEILKRSDIPLEGRHAVSRRPVQRGRQARRAAAAPRERHRHRLPLEDRSTSPGTPATPRSWSWPPASRA